MLARAKYMARRPSKANTLDVKTMNVSRVMARMAGMESAANTTSVVSTITSTTKRGVAKRMPSFFTKNLSPSICRVMGKCRLRKRTTGLFSGSISGPSPLRPIRMPVYTKKAPSR